MLIHPLVEMRGPGYSHGPPTRCYASAKIALVSRGRESAPPTRSRSRTHRHETTMTPRDMATGRTLTDHDVHRIQRARLRAAVERSVRKQRERGAVPGPAAKLVERVAKHVTPEVGLLVWTACRWGELQTLDVGRLQDNRQAWIWQSKVGAWRSTPRLTTGEAERWRSVADDIQIPDQSRKRVSRWIRRALRGMGWQPPRSVLAGTHLVRHVTASALAWRGWDVGEIADRLGHSDTQTTTEYIHSAAAWSVA